MKGFTLIEILIYLALTSLILTGSISTAFYILITTQKTQRTINQTEELNAFYNLMSWIVNDATIIAPVPNQSSEELITYEKGVQIKVFLQNNLIYMQIDETPPLPLTSENTITQFSTENLYSKILFCVYMPNYKFQFLLP
jgi:type II secretory pathway component PulJ